ncbi:MAG: phosphonoacetaldehyde reductase [Christensenellaceae bacterium]
MAQSIIVSYDFGNDLQRTLAGVKGVLLVCDAAFLHLPIKAAFDGLTAQVICFSSFTPNPQYEDVCKGVTLFNQNACNAIVAVGGGSTMDVAKCIKLFCKMNPDKNYLEQPFPDSGVPLIAVPTTAGTGSESTRFAVIYFDGKKQSITHPSIIPNYALLSPEVLKTLPLYQKKCTLLDAFCQGVESWWSVNSTEESKMLSKRAVSMIVHDMDEYLAENTERAAAQIMLAANLAGQAINITQTTAAHAMSYKLTSLYHLPHGHAVALCFPEVWGYMLSHMEHCIDPREAEYLKTVFQEIAEALGCKSAEKAVEWFADVMKRLEMKMPLSGDRAHDITILADSVNPTRLANNPIALDREAFIQMYNRVLN